MNLQVLTDKIAIALSLLCTLHCLALPLALVLFPSLLTLHLDNEIFHIGMVVAVIPTSLYALTLGCKQHKQVHLFAIGCLGLVFLVSALVLGEALFGEFGEKVLTFIGSIVLAFGHIRNFQYCQRARQKSDSCSC